MPRINLGEVIIDLNKNETIVISPESILTVSPSSFAGLKFTFNKIQLPGEQDDFEIDKKGNLRSFESYDNDTTIWNQFVLVTKFLTNNGIESHRQNIEL
ncbi:MAG: hypothetical protein AAF363_18320 [Bacteroidota bacterium]